MRQKSSEQIRQPQSAGIVPHPGDKKKRVYPLNTFNAVKLWSGNTIGRGAEMLEELFFDLYSKWTFSDVTRYARERYGNIDMHVRCYGGPVKMQWYNLPKLSEMEGKTVPETVTPPKEKHLTRRVQELEIERENLRLELELQKARNNEPDRSAVADAPAPAPEEDNSLEAVINMMVKALLPVGAAWVAKKLEETGNIDPNISKTAIIGILAPTMAKQTAPTQAQAIADNADEQARPGNPRPYAVDDDDFDIPIRVLEFFDRVDWTRTAYVPLLEKLENFAGMIGIEFKPPAGG